MDVAFKNFIYEMYSRDLSEKVKSGVTTCMKRGEYYAGCMVYGYQKSSDGKRMEIDEGAAVTIRRIFGNWQMEKVQKLWQLNLTQREYRLD